MSDIIFKTDYRQQVNTAGLNDIAKKVNIYKAKNPTLSFFSSGSMHGGASSKRPFRDGEYDLYEVGRIIDTESLVMRAFSKKNTLVFRDGFRITSDNETNLKYIKKRISEIEYVSELKFEDLLREYAFNLIAYHNPYIVKVRKATASSGEVRKYRGKTTIDPVAAYYCLAPETMQRRVDSSGTPLRFRQYLLNSQYREFSPKNIIYTPFNKRSGFTMGTPPLESVSEDILALRRIEESVETLIYKSLFPIIHVKVGTDKVPAKTLPNGQTEIAAATSLLENIDDNGGIVTSERIDLTSIGAESIALRVETYLAHFKKRVFAGLGMSAIDFGDGDSTGRATGEVLSSALRDSVVTYQNVLAEMVTHEMFTELLLESGKYRNPFDIPEEDMVYLSFNTVDTDELIKKESHTIQKLSAGIIKTNEARKELNLTPLGKNEIKEIHTVIMSDLEHARALSLSKASSQQSDPAGAKAPAKKTIAKKATVAKKRAGAAKSASSKVSPKNQYKDSLRNILDSSDNKQLVIARIMHVLPDACIQKLTDGVLLQKDYYPEEISQVVDQAKDAIIDTLHNTAVRSVHKEVLYIVEELFVEIANLDLG